MNRTSHLIQVKSRNRAGLLIIFFTFLWLCGPGSAVAAQPNIILIYADDLGYGDVGCYGATKVKTPHIDKLAVQGVRFTDGHCTSATCTPSRYGMLTGEYPWRKKGTGILPGDAKMIIPAGSFTLPEMLRKGGYKTAVVGKWHLGLGDSEIDWNKEIKPGPREIGFDYSFLIPATVDRVPCVYVENQKVVNLDPKDPIAVDYQNKIGSDPTGRENPELLKMKFLRGHDNTIVNGISRIGFMSGGKSARWVDEDIADVITRKAVDFIEQNVNRPFFLYFATHDIHVPRTPHARFKGTSQCGLRGDVIQEFDWCIGEIVAVLDRLKLADNTLLILTSDNGAVINDGYADDSVEDLNGHKASGPLRGGKYSLFEGGTRIPFIVRWPKRIKPAVSDALVSQVDFLASFARLTGQKLPSQAGPDSFDTLDAFLGDSKKGRDHLVEHAHGQALRKGPWKFIPASKDAKRANAENGIAAQDQLYDLAEDLGEKKNLSSTQPKLVAELAAQLEMLQKASKSRP